MLWAPSRIADHVVEQTTIERYSFDPEQIKETFADAWDACEHGNFDDFVLELFEEYDGSEFGRRFFHNDVSPDIGRNVIKQVRRPI